METEAPSRRRDARTLYSPTGSPSRPSLWHHALSATSNRYAFDTCRAFVRVGMSGDPALGAQAVLQSRRLVQQHVVFADKIIYTHRALFGHERELILKFAHQQAHTRLVDCGAVAIDHPARTRL